METPIKEQLLECQERISLACRNAHRPSNSVLLIAVSKTHTADKVVQAYQAGQRHFGENYVQECSEKITELKTSCPEIIWHFIGPLQSNKTRIIAEQVDWVQSIDRLKIAERLSSQRPSHLHPLQVLVQVNISGELTKSGIEPSEAQGLCEQILALPNIELRGLMAIPEPGSSPQSLSELYKLFNSVKNNLGSKVQFDTLSMGMSDDLEAAIQAGSTMVRIGTAIFGQRIKKP
jgi:pyridoxal phosphate enzyme (YggS family)